MIGGNFMAVSRLSTCQYGKFYLGEAVTKTRLKGDYDPIRSIGLVQRFRSNQDPIKRGLRPGAAVAVLVMVLCSNQDPIKRGLRPQGSFLICWGCWAVTKTRLKGDYD